MPKLYRINNWKAIYENNRTRTLKNMSWFPLPVKLNGDGFTLMMEEKDGVTIFGCFIILLEIASTCNPRGTLIRSNGEPHDSRSIMRLSRMNVRDCDRCLQFCSTTLKWLICEEIENPAPIAHEGAAIAHDSALYNSTEHNNTEHDNTEQYLHISNHLKKRILEKRQANITDATINGWNKVCRLMVDRDKRTAEQINQIIDECHDMPKTPSGFTWADNILSMDKLRKQWNDGKIYIGMNKKNTAPAIKTFDVNAYHKKLIEEQNAS
jgi:hypothetical protein